MATAAFSDSAIDSAIRRAAEKLGYSKLRHQQVRVVKNFARQRRICESANLKSLCYCILPATFDSLFGLSDGLSIAVVVSPLISLMSYIICNELHFYMFFM